MAPGRRWAGPPHVQDHSFDREFSAAISGALGGIGGAGGFHRLITQLVNDRFAADGNGTTYRRPGELMLAELRQLVATTEKDVTNLRPLAPPSAGRGARRRMVSAGWGTVHLSLPRPSADSLPALSLGRPRCDSNLVHARPNASRSRMREVSACTACPSRCTEG
jgi:hypothetical protein